VIATLDRAVLEIRCGDVDVGMLLGRQGCEAYLAHMGTFHLSERAVSIAMALLDVGRVAEADEFVERAEHIQQTTDERYFAAKVLRAKAHLSIAAGEPGLARDRLEAALEMAPFRPLRTL
jgi:hypothetical protein